MNTNLSRAGLPDLPERAFDGSHRLYGKSDAPAPPDYTAAAQATAAGNLAMAKAATEANRVNQYTPWGSSTWTNNRSFDQAGYDAAMNAYQQKLAAHNNQPQSSSNGSWQYNNNEGAEVWVPGSSSGSSASGPAPVAPDRNDFYGGDNWQQRITLSPSQQALFDQNNALQTGLFGTQNDALANVNSTMSKPFDASTLPAAGEAYDPAKATNTATQAIMSRLDPSLDRQQAALQTQLANQGIPLGSAAYNTAMQLFGQQRNDATTQAALQGINLGMAQQGQTYNQQTNNRQQALQLASYLRSLPLNELNALRTGNQVSQPSFPGYSQQATTAGPDLVGAAQNTYNAQVANANAANAGSAGMMGGLFSLGGSILGAPAGSGGAALASSIGGLFSDRRLKHEIKRIGTADNGLPIYSYRYKWGGPTMLGFMADEVERVSPEAVGEIAGFKTVDYSKVH